MREKTGSVMRAGLQIAGGCSGGQTAAARQGARGFAALVPAARVAYLPGMSKPAPIFNGLRLRCGHCGQGRLFSGYLKLNEACPHCGRDMRAADTADGPAFFVGFGVLILTAPFLFLIPMSPLPGLLKIGAILLLGLAITGLSLWLLPVAKAILLNLQLHHKSGQAEFDRNDA
ncbi:DUF983 domain-containing protein [Hyphomonas sp.]|uniref:DUF983 domain-containing protein n=1 Tax=Hyphomonas sp. TaxID=87 RepID=UPI001DEAD9CF|nr:DUF983 domain-containing protein [Hyphomonas sp.]MBU4062768.1 DUF983 domain-containing protein [Alphaproteobacteria bacterium]MBU4163687.1 DUF983 domain-containing protein [Alphaproteobacteria bacterium]